MAIGLGCKKTHAVKLEVFFCLNTNVSLSPGGQKTLPFSNSNPEGHHESASENGYVDDDYKGEKKTTFSTPILIGFLRGGGDSPN